MEVDFHERNLDPHCSESEPIEDTFAFARVPSGASPKEVKERQICMNFEPPLKASTKPQTCNTGPSQVRPKFRSKIPSSVTSKSSSLPVTTRRQATQEEKAANDVKGQGALEKSAETSPKGEKLISEDFRDANEDEKGDSTIGGAVCLMQEVTFETEGKMQVQKRQSVQQRARPVSLELAEKEKNGKTVNKDSMTTSVSSKSHSNNMHCLLTESLGQELKPASKTHQRKSGVKDKETLSPQDIAKVTDAVKKEGEYLTLRSLDVVTKVEPWQLSTERENSLVVGRRDLEISTVGDLTFDSTCESSGVMNEFVIRDDLSFVQSSMTDAVDLPPDCLFETRRALEEILDEDDAAEDEFLAASQNSLTSSLGILNESDILDVSNLLLHEELHGNQQKSRDDLTEAIPGGVESGASDIQQNVEMAGELSPESNRALMEEETTQVVVSEKLDSVEKSEEDTNTEVEERQVEVGDAFRVSAECDALDDVVAEEKLPSFELSQLTQLQDNTSDSCHLRLGDDDKFQEMENVRDNEGSAGNGNVKTEEISNDRDHGSDQNVKAEKIGIDHDCTSDQTVKAEEVSNDRDLRIDQNIKSEKIINDLDRGSDQNVKTEEVSNDHESDQNVTAEEASHDCDFRNDQNVKAEEASSDRDHGSDAVPEEVEAEDRSRSTLIIQVQLERQLFDRQHERLSYENALYVCPVDDGRCVNGKSESGLEPPANGSSSEAQCVVSEKQENVERSGEDTKTELEAQQATVEMDAGEATNGKKGTNSVGAKTEGGKLGGKGGALGDVTNKGKLLRNMQSQQSPIANEQRNGEVKRTLSEKTDGDNVRNTGEAVQLTSGKAAVGFPRKLKKTPSQNSPATSKTVAALKADDLSSISSQRRPRNLSLDLGNTVSSSPAALAKRNSLKREPPKIRSVGINQKDEKKTTEETRKTQATEVRRKPGLVVHSSENSSTSTRHTRTPSESDLADGHVGSILARRTSTPQSSVLDSSFNSGSVPGHGVRRGSQMKQHQPNKKDVPGKSNAQVRNGQLKSRLLNTGKNERSASQPQQVQPQPQQQLQPQPLQPQPQHEPDLIPTSVTIEKHQKEIIRLEHLCESRGREISCLRVEVQRRINAFHALVIVAQYLSQLVDSEERAELRNHVKETSVQLNAALQLLHEQTEQRAALINEIQALKEKAESERLKLAQDHQHELIELQKRLQELHKEDLQRADDDHKEKLSSLEVHHQEQVDELKELHSQVLSKSQLEHSADLAALKSEYDGLTQELRQQQAHQLNEITLCFDHIKFSLSEKVEVLRNECEELRMRETTYMDSCQREMEQKLQLAIAPYRHLPQEIESLRAVLDLRNLELHGLRQQNFDLQRQLDNLPAAHETIKRLEQKVENLEAIIKIRTDYERELSEKHQQLLRRLDRESKTNKRLSMDKEELMWRLSSFQGSPSSETSFLESIHLLPGHSSTGDGSAVASPTQETLSNMRMQRSGTYDLLCQATEDDNKSTQK